MPGAAQRLRDDGADRGVVVDDQDRAGHGHAGARGSRMRKTVIAGVALARILDDAAHVADQLVDQREAQPLPLRLARDERIEQMLGDVGGRAGAVVDHADLDRQRLARPARRRRSTDMPWR